ncbi:BTAD domain-containing putative transcriptional regulator [Actinomadura algeriensis]|uniref:ATPase/DNA-binding SARP family transcriptional activator n=1 Tax=Actinomadura algeriensis TaxID=1679523 RepID=A0ABR9JTI3_9ACTN|nr:BTAD domain-containing putative transcriptional regulator [Actinomadura algeriensis]MBE1533882.1 putative ATPase/DNA-binding SARP family transcriptional activator [Actinomadura algeriensis]
MRFGVLGALAVWTDDGALVPVPGIKVRALLADLLAHEGRPVPADRLIDDLWGEALPGNPAGALSAKVSQLRRVLEDAEPGARAIVQSRPAGYLLAAEAARVDARRFESLVDEARGAAAPKARADLLGEALGTWRGAAFADFADEPFARPAAARLEELRLTALEEHAEVRLELGEHGPVAGELAAAVAAHPLRERLRAVHMRALYRAGRQHEALEGFARFRELLADELGLDPGAELTSLHGAILRRDPVLDARSAPRSNLPVPPTALIGRAGAVADVRARLGTDRLVTLTGPGGVGKTRLAVEVASGLADAFADGVWLVELAALDRAAVPDPADAVTAVLDVHDAPGGPGTPVDRLAAALAGRRLLLVLDNCEHVVEQAAGLAERLLRRVPGLRVLATSREPLGPPGEVVWAVPPLDVPARDGPDDPAALARSGAVRLFAARAEAAARGFRLDGETAAAVAVLCRRLDGIPLALELAATRVRTLGVAGLVARLDDRFRLLATGHRGAPPRQRTLTAMIDWSWDLLAEPERAVLRRLSVHADGCAVDAAEAVCAGAGVPAEEVLDLLVRLVDRSLVVLVERPGEEPRYRLLESVAAYGADRLRDAGEHALVRSRHSEYYAGLAERADLRGAGQTSWLRTLDAEAANLRAALDTAVADAAADRALRLVGALAWYWFLRGRLGEALRSLDAALALDGGAPVPRARAVTWRAGLATLMGDVRDRAARRAEALRLVDAAGDAPLAAWARWFLAFAASDVDDLAAADAVSAELLAAFRESGDAWGEAATLLLRAKQAFVHNDTAALERDASRAAALFGDLGDRWGRLQATEWLGGLAEMTGDYDRAERSHLDGQRMAEELRLWPDVAARLAWRGWIAVVRGDPERALRLCGRALRVATEQGHVQLVAFAESGLGLAERHAGMLDAARERLTRLMKDVSPDEFPPLSLTLSQTGLGYVAELRGDADTAVRFHRDVLAIALRLESPRDVAAALEGLAGAYGLAGDHPEAAALLGKAAAVRAGAGLPASPAERTDIDRAAGRARTALGPDAFAAAFADGPGRDPADVLRHAETTAGPSPWRGPPGEQAI